ncbi:MAG: hypothetical protein NTU62_14540 [Spirochaetes bacterium]|nr:hypothetical protein [Spirochaetota bacterium]
MVDVTFFRQKEEPVGVPPEHGQRSLDHLRERRVLLHGGEPGRTRSILGNWRIEIAVRCPEQPEKLLALREI